MAGKNNKDFRDLNNIVKASKKLIAQGNQMLADSKERRAQIKKATNIGELEKIAKKNRKNRSNSLANIKTSDIPLTADLKKPKSYSFTASTPEKKPSFAQIIKQFYQKLIQRFMPSPAKAQSSKQATSATAAKDGQTSPQDRITQQEARREIQQNIREIRNNIREANRYLSKEGQKILQDYNKASKNLSALQKMKQDPQNRGKKENLERLEQKYQNIKAQAVQSIKNFPNKTEAQLLKETLTSRALENDLHNNKAKINSEPKPEKQQPSIVNGIKVYGQHTQKIAAAKGAGAQQEVKKNNSERN